MTAANIQRKNTFLNWGISIVVGLVLSAGLSATISYDVSTIAGQSPLALNDGAVATAATLNNPLGIFVHSSGDVYFADTDNNRIRKITATTGVISTIAGTGASSFTGDGGPAVNATLNIPRGVYLDSSDNIYIADSFNNRIRKITATTGVISTLQSGLNRPRGIFLDNSNNIYFADSNNHRVCKIVSGTMSVIAGITGTASFTGDGAAATAATLNTPSGIYVDSSNNVYIADTGNNHIRMIAGSTASIFGSARTVGNIYTIAGGSVTTAGFAGDGASATAAAVRFNSPYSVCLDSAGNVCISDTSNNRIRILINTAGTYFGNSRTANFIYTIAGTGTAGFLDGAATTVATLSAPQGVAADTAGNIYITEGGNGRVRKLVGSTVSTIAGGFGDGGAATGASFSSPWDLTTDSSGNIYIADTSHSLIRKIAAGTGIISTVGNGTNTDGLAVDSSGNVYNANYGSNTITKFTLTGGTYTSSVFAGSGSAGNANGTGVSASFRGPSRIAFGPSGNLYVADQNNHTIRMITPAGVVSTIAGIAQTSGFLDGNGTIAKFLNPSGIAVDSSENIFVTEQSTNSTIRKIMNSGGAYTVSTIAGANGATVNGTGYVDGSGTVAKFNSPVGIGVDRAGSIYVADKSNNKIRKLTYSGGVYTVSTIAGGISGTTDGTGIAALFNGPAGLCVDSFGNILVADNTSNRIRKLLSKLAFSGSGTLSATATGTAYIQGGGTAVLPPSNSISAVEVSNGTLQVSSSVPITFNASGGSAIVEILAAMNTGAYTFTTPGAVKIGTGVAAILDAPSGTSLMSKTGAGRLQAVDNLSSSTTPIAVSEGILEVSGASGKLPNAATSVASGGTLQLGTSGGTVAAGAVANASVASGGIMSILAGATGAVTSADISSGGIVSVAAGVTAPSGMFTSPTFRSGGILQVGDGATLGQSFTSVA